MESPILIALSHQMALRRQLDLVSNNVANMNTAGFKQQRMQFNEFLEKPAANEQVSFVIDRAAVRDIGPGSLTATGNQLDLALNGPGYFVVDTVNGPRYTRAGHFQLNPQRQIVDLGGLPVLNSNGQPITLPDNTAQVRIDSEGNVFTELDANSPVGKINLVTFQREQQMSEVGSGLYATAEQPQPAGTTTKIQQGMIEESNVKPVVEMTQMIEVMRQYQAAQKMIDAEVERQRGMISRLGRVS